MRWWPLLGLALLSVTIVRAENPAPVGTRIADFTLPQPATDKPWSLLHDARSAKAVVVLFISTQCPVSNQYMPIVANLHKKAVENDVTIVAINSVPHDTPAAVKHHAEEYKLPFPVLKDADGALAQRFHVERIPTAFVLDGTRTVRYRGRIDDQIERSIRRPAATSHDLVNAVQAVLAGQPVTTPNTPVVGCPLPTKRTQPVANAAITYTQHVAGILQKHCQECHRPGEIGPFALMNYADASNWASAIREVVNDNLMPPWHADPKHGKFVNDRRLSAADKKTLLDWIEQGCAEGDAKHLPPARNYTTGWGIGTPDVVLKMNKAYRVPAATPRNGIPYQFFAVGEPFAEDKWVTAAEVRPGNRGVVHHIIVHMFPPGMRVPGLASTALDLIKAVAQKPQAPMKMPEWLTAYVPGDQPVTLPKGLARKIPKGTQLVFELHYTPNGRAGTDVSSLGLVFAPEPPKHEVSGDMLVNEQFEIPPGAANHRVTATKNIPVDCMLISMNPHMHLRGKSFQYDLVLADGTREVLLAVPKYDFNWQSTYTLAEPKRLPKGSKIECIAHYDNSKDNPNNPNPNKAIHWGDQTWDEMMLGYLEYYIAPK